MKRRLPTLRGRGTDRNPANRFEKLEIDFADPTLGEGLGDDRATTAGERPAPVTEVLRDRSRSIVTRNESPDVPFEASVNPYRGCSHGCVYCVSGETSILLADGCTRPMEQIRPGDEIIGTRGRGGSRRRVATRVLDRWTLETRAVRVVFTEGAPLIVGEHHRFLAPDGWRFTTPGGVAGARRPHLVPGSPLPGTGSFSGNGASPGTDPTGSGSGRTVAAIESLGVRRLHDMRTGTGDYVSDGVVSHNCYARPTHEYLGFSAGLDFETRILVKEDAPDLLRETLADPRWEPTPLAMSGVTDPYQPVERKLGVTRRCLQVLARCRHPVAVVTKSHRVTRDRDLLARLARHGAARVRLSVTTLDEDLRRVMEPRAPTADRRLDAIARLREAGIPVGVLVAPVIPGLTEHEIPRILEAAAAAGADRASWVLLRLPHGVEELFAEWLDRHFPDRKAKILSRLRDTRGGKLYDPAFGARMRGEGPYAAHLRELFRVAARRHGLEGGGPPLRTDAFRPPPRRGQLDLFRETS